MSSSNHHGGKRHRNADLSADEADREIARAAHLHYELDDHPGFGRRKRGAGFVYFDDHDRRLADQKVLQRIVDLVIPPAWTDVWISPRANGHLQATGRDARGRKQYRYHDRWRSACDEIKYQRLIRFAKTLPQIRRRVAAHLRQRGTPKQKVLAGVVKLLETTLIRVGNEEYAASNDSFGLTTMRDKHVDVHGSEICFDFHGKSGVAHEITTSNRKLASLVRKCKGLPGRELFQYVDEAGAVHDIRSQDVNDYLREISGGDFTAKDFRTWAGTVLAARALKEFENVDSQAAARRNVRTAIERVAKRLGNTVAVCRKCYVHPAVIDAYLDQGLVETLKSKTKVELRGAMRHLSAEEGAVLVLLQRQLARGAAGKKSR